ncbi:hypothetical protein RQP46_002106 [Phenoliferia psychrophenolica]
MAQLSLWLCPAPPPASALAPFLTQLAAELSTVQFSPHATLVSDEIVPRDLPTDQLVQLIRNGIDAWSRQHGHSLTLDFLDVRQGSQFYQCILAALVPSTPLLALHEALLAAFSLPIPSPPTYFPHLSLIYDDKLSHDDKAKVIADLEARGDVVKLDATTDQQTTAAAGVRIKGERGFSPSEVVLVKTQGPPAEWEVLARVPLAKKQTEQLVMLGATGAAACEGETCEF